jgi:hypothetical protein
MVPVGDPGFLPDVVALFRHEEMHLLKELYCTCKAQSIVFADIFTNLRGTFDRKKRNLISKSLQILPKYQAWGKMSYIPSPQYEQASYFSAD